MSSLELLQHNLAIERPHKTILIIDTGKGWQATVYGPDSAGAPAPETYITLPAALSRIEELMVNLRRQPDVRENGVVITDEAEIIKALNEMSLTGEAKPVLS